MNYVNLINAVRKLDIKFSQDTDEGRINLGVKDICRERVFGERERVHSIIIRGRHPQPKEQHEQRIRNEKSMEYSENDEQCGQRKARWAPGGMAPDEARPP